MAYYKAPGWVAFVEQLPVTATQKVQRGELREAAARCIGKAGLFRPAREQAAPILTLAIR